MPALMFFLALVFAALATFFGIQDDSQMCVLMVSLGCLCYGVNVGWEMHEERKGGDR